MILWRVNPPHLPIIDKMDSINPATFSLKHQLSQAFANESEAHLRETERGGMADEIFLLERIRREFYPTLSSRLNAIFCFGNIAYAEKFAKSGWTEAGGVIVKYDLVNLYRPVFVGDMALTNVISNLRKNWEQFKSKQAPFIKSTLQESLELVVHFYWQGKIAGQIGLGENNSIMETLIDGVAKRILPPPPLEPGHTAL